MNLPADNLAAVDIHDQIEIKEHTRDWPRHPGDVPSPDLAGRICLVTGNWWVVCVRWAVWRGPDDAAAPLRARCGRSLIPLCVMEAKYRPSSASLGTI